MTTPANTTRTTKVILARASACRKATADRDWNALLKQGVITEKEYRFARRFGRTP